MSLTVQHINGDSSFLLTFSPKSHPAEADLKSSNGGYSVLIDPWLVGPSIVTAPWFAITQRVIPACIRHLSEIEEPDVVVVSQNKPDHCHRETLLQLRPQGKTIVAAEPGAAKAIRSWKHFYPYRVIGLQKYNPKDEASSLRLYLPPLSPSGHAGEVAISFIPARNYVTGLHNAIGITYQAPTRFKSAATVSTVDLPQTTRFLHVPFHPNYNSHPSPSLSCPLSFDELDRKTSDSRSSCTDERLCTLPGPRHQEYSKTTTNGFADFADFGLIPLKSSGANSSTTHDVDELSPQFHPTVVGDGGGDGLPVGIYFDAGSSATLSTPPASPSQSSPPLGSHHVPMSSTASQQSLNPPSSSTITPGRLRPVSVLYSPHGIPFSPDLIPYTQHHLVRLGALPLTLLLHGLNHVQNSWYMGGNIMAGSANGVEIARGLMARCWLSAHDELKDDRGLAVRQLKLTRRSPEEVRRSLWAGKEGEWLSKRGWDCDVRSLSVGASMFLGPARALVTGMEGREDV